MAPYGVQRGAARQRANGMTGPDQTRGDQSTHGTEAYNGDPHAFPLPLPNCPFF
jgi:hypothetical protein